MLRIGSKSRDRENENIHVVASKATSLLEHTKLILKTNWRYIKFYKNDMLNWSNHDRYEAWNW